MQACGINGEDDCGPHDPSPKLKTNPKPKAPGSSKKRHGGEADVENEYVNPDLGNLLDARNKQWELIQKCNDNRLAPGCMPVTSSCPITLPSDPADYDPYHPDYSSTTLGIGPISLAWTQDRYKQNYFSVGFGFGVSWLIVPWLSISHTDGWIGGVGWDNKLDSYVPDRRTTSDFLGGDEPSISISAGFVGGVGKTFSNIFNTMPIIDSTERCWYSPQVGGGIAWVIKSWP